MAIITAPRKAGQARAVVIGGSISGLFAGLLLRQAGWDAEVFERTETELTGRGAGIVTHVELCRVLAAVGLDPSRNLGVEVAGRKTLDRAGRVIGEYPCPQTLTSWDRVFRMLREAFPAECYHLGRELAKFEERGERIGAHFSDGSRAEGDVLVGADGFRSTVRVGILPEVRPVYAGYVAWRGLVAEDVLSRATRADIFDSLVFCLPPGEQILGYPVAGPDNDLRRGHRRYNFVWYRPADATALQRLLTDASGQTHVLSIPPPLVRADVIRDLRDAAERLLPPQMQEVVNLTPQPFLQPIYDVETSHMAVGRVALMGDAAFLGRPHVAAGVTKAAEDAFTLVAALKSGGDMRAALQRYERSRMDIDRRIVARGRDLGIYLQPGLLTPEERKKAERHRSPEAVMAEIAVLDFLRV
jgi:2-polyprenyl-6-methoxyphenol hydroxylase-like FAD-dependent oxidoreductase